MQAAQVVMTQVAKVFLAARATGALRGAGQGLVLEWELIRLPVAAVEEAAQLVAQPVSVEVVGYASLLPLYHHPHPALPKRHSTPCFQTVPPHDLPHGYQA